MNLDDTVSSVIEERLHFVKHKGKAIFVIDFSHCTSKEMICAARAGAGDHGTATPRVGADAGRLHRRRDR